MARPLKWMAVDGEDTEMPDCVSCTLLWTDPMFVEAVYSVGIEQAGDPFESGKKVIESFHERGHAMTSAPPARVRRGRRITWDGGSG